MMADRWYFGQGEAKHGPFTGQELKDKATRGEIVPTDTVWKEGVAKGALASRVQHLFQAVQVVALVEPPVAPVAEATPLPSHEVGLVPLEGVDPSPAPRNDTPPTPVEPPAEKAPQAAPPAAKNHVRTGRATAGKGAIIMSQDGVNVKFRKKCTVCSNEDASWTTVPIRSGTMRSPFYCRKCRKSREVEVHGSLN